MLNKARLYELLGYLYDVRRIQCSVHRLDGTELHSSEFRSAYCDLICSIPRGYQHCLQCDRTAIQRVQQLRAPFQYRCHAGAIDAAIPVIIGGDIAAVILFGQMLDDSPVDKQWEKAQKNVLWYPKMQELREAFYHLPRLTGREIKGCYELVNACVSETRMEQLSARNTSGIAQWLALYLSEHYAEPLTLGALSHALNLSVSRLCALANQVAPGMTIGKLISQHRVNAAKHLLVTTDQSIRDIAAQVGICDYNYFTKVFKKLTGKTPSAYRRETALRDPT